MNIRRGLATAAVALLAVGILSSCTTHAPADSIILYYKAGPTEAKQFESCIEPGTSGDMPVNDEIFQIPTSLRTWNIRPEGGDTADPIKSGTLPVTLPATDANGAGALINQPGPEVVVYATADFYLNTDCAGGRKSPLVQFWEATGRRYGISADGEDGFSQENFRTMLLNTLVPAEEKAIRAETRKYTADDLDANINDVWRTMERNLAPSFLAELKAKLGGDYFCGVGYRRGAEVSWTEWKVDGKDANGQPRLVEKKVTGTCPPVRITITDVNFADPAIAAARTRVFTEKQNAEAEQIKANSERDRAVTLREAAKDPGYVELKRIEAQRLAAEACKSNPNCTVIIGNSPVLAGK